MKVEEHNNVGHGDIIYGGLCRQHANVNIAECGKTSVFFFFNVIDINFQSRRSSKRVSFCVFEPPLNYNGE